MADVGEVLLAEEYRKQLGLPESVLTVSPAQVGGEARRTHTAKISDAQLVSLGAGHAMLNVSRLPCQTW